MDWEYSALQMELPWNNYEKPDPDMKMEIELF